MSVFTGVAAALVTIFDENLDVDLAATAALAGHLHDAGMRAVVVGGSTGEVYSLSEDERSRLVSGVRAALPSAVPVIAGTGAPSGRQAARLTEMAVDAGADAVLALSPPRSVDPRPYYEAVATAAGPVQVLAYHFPAASSPGITMEHLRELPVAGIKDSTGDPNRLLDELTTYDGDTFVGSSAILTQAGALGAPGAILALANAQPEDCAAAFAGEADAQLRLAPHHRGLAPFPTGIKSQVCARWGLPAHRRMG